MSALEFPPRPEEEEKVTKRHITQWKKTIALENHPNATVGLPEEERVRREEKFKEDMEILARLQERLGLGKKSTTPETTKAITDQRSSVPARGARRAVDRKGEVLGTEVRETYVDFEEGEAASTNEARVEPVSPKRIAGERRKTSKKKGAKEFTPGPDDIIDPPRSEREEASAKKELPVIEHAPLSKEDGGTDDELLLDDEVPHQAPATEEEKAEEAALAKAIERSSGTDPEMIPASEVRTQENAYNDEDIAEARGHMEELRDGEQEARRRWEQETMGQFEHLGAFQTAGTAIEVPEQTPESGNQEREEEEARWREEIGQQFEHLGAFQHAGAPAETTSASAPASPPVATAPAAHGHGGHAHGHGGGIKGIFKGVLGFGLVVGSIVFTGIWKMFEAPIKAIFENAKLGKGGGGGGGGHGGGHDDHGGGHDDHH